MRKAFDIGFGRTEEELSINKLKITGAVPEWLCGSLYRNGPGSFSVGDEHYRHWFDGLAMLHRFSFESGSVSYQNRYLDCKAYRSATERNRITLSEFATNPDSSFVSVFRMLFQSPMTDSAKVNIARLGKSLFALGETSTQMQFDPESLQSIQPFYYDSNTGRHVTTVHPIHDRFEGADYNITTRFSRVNHYRILKVGENKKPKLQASLSVNEVAYMHSFGMSPNYFIITEFPFLANPLKILFSGKPFIENYRWKPDKGTRIYLIERKSGKLVAKIVSDPFFAFHHTNAFEKDGHLFMDIACYNDSEVVNAFYLDKIRSDSETLPCGEMRRYAIDLGNFSISYDVLAKEGVELPRYDEATYSFEDKNNFIYGVGVNSNKTQSFYNQLVKLDLSSGKARTWYEDGSYPGEAVFIPRPERSAEDDGVLASVTLDENKQSSFLLLLDARDLKELARIEVPHTILFGYHGIFEAK